jgi:glutamate-ammonia-ligase adenylyltransferase
MTESALPPDLLPLADASPDPARAKLALERILAGWPSELPAWPEVLAAYGEAREALMHLLAVSPVSVDKLVRDPAALVWLAQPEIRALGRRTTQMRKDLEEIGPRPPRDLAVKPEHFAPLRRWKQREMLRLALRDVGGLANVEQTTGELSQLAEICVREVTEAWLADFTRRLGDPGSGFCVLGMGKFGGQELNYSSDIDVIFFHGEPGELASGLSRQEFFTRVAQRIIETFSAIDAAGPLFRIDLRLRPEGDSGPLVFSLDGMENYYAAFGETWERMALSKARLVAGDDELGYEFFQRLQAFIYPRTVAPEMIDEVAHIKGRIEREVVGAANLHRDVKLGRGGIREIEFVCQSLQLLHGARHAFLQERSTLRALRGLRQLDLLPPEEMDALAAAYRFLRTVEHRLQIENEAQTHTLPESAEARERLGRSLAAGGVLPRSSEFAPELARHTEKVRAIFEKVMRSPESAPAPRGDISFFHDATKAERALADLGGTGSGSISPRTKKLFARLEPLLLARLRDVADPDAALTRLARFAERYGMRGALFETLLTNPRVLELLVKLFDASAFLSEIAIRRPQLVEEVARLGDLGEPIPCVEHLAGLARNDEGLSWKDWVRVYRRALQLRIGLRDLLGFASLREVWSECSALAEACLVFTQRELGLAGALTVIGLGKFGGRELGYGADLDVVFIGGDPAAAAQLMKAMTEQTAEGRVFPVDARLRPEGDKGQLAITLAEWEDYFARGRGHLWEAQALTKARPMSGPQQGEWLAAAQRVWREHGRRADLFEQVGAMLARVSEHRGADVVLDFKTGPGGLMQLEFFTQARQMRAGLWEPNTLNALARLDVADGAEITAAYLFLRKIETVLRRMDDTSVSSLPAEEAAQRRLAKRCGLESRDELLERVRTARGVIAQSARLA